MVYFASTRRLNLREARESDRDVIFNLFNDPVVQRGPAYSVPLGLKKRKGILEVPDKVLFFAVIESKGPLGEGSNGAPSPHITQAADASDEKLQKDVKPEDLFVGLAFLHMTSEKNRDASLAIGLDEKWRGRGYGTEVMRWLVDYSFENLGLHRMSLTVMDDNYPAIALYKSVGYVEEGRLRKTRFENGKWGDIISMGQLYEDWAASRNQVKD